MFSVELHTTDNDGEQIIDRLHEDTTRVEARLTDNGNERTIDRLRRSMGCFDLRTV